MDCLASDALVSLRYGKSHLRLMCPAGTTVLESPGADAAPDATKAVRDALAQPIGTAPLRNLLLAKRPRTVAITISDITRPVPNEPILTGLLGVLNAAGIPDASVVVIIATGMHRPSTPEERLILLGDRLLERLEVIDHVADDPSHILLPGDPPVRINARYANADFKIVTGLIEPHFMAGYSGGRKGVCPGLVDLSTVQRFHGHRIMADPRSTEGRLDDNPCHAESLRVARLVGVDFLVNVSITGDRRLAAVYAGEMEAAHAAGCRDVARQTSAAVARPFDLVITSAGGFPLDQSFYQTVKGMVTALPALHEQSTLLIASACNVVGSGEYAGMMARYANDWQRFLRDIEASSVTAKDQWQFQMQSRVLAKIGMDRLLFAGDGLPLDLQRQLCVTPLPGDGTAEIRAQQFIDAYRAAHPNARIAIIPEGPYTMLTRNA